MYLHLYWVICRNVSIFTICCAACIFQKATEVLERRCENLKNTHLILATLTFNWWGRNCNKYEVRISASKVNNYIINGLLSILQEIFTALGWVTVASAYSIYKFAHDIQPTKTFLVIPFDLAWKNGRERYSLTCVTTELLSSNEILEKWFKQENAILFYYVGYPFAPEQRCYK